MNNDFYSAIRHRRSYYAIDNTPIVSDEKIKEIVDFAVKYTPSAFNSQSARVIVLTGKSHENLWQLTKETLQKVVPPDSFSSTEEKLASFRNGYGTILFFEDQAVIQGLQKKFELYKENFPIWSEQSSGMLQFTIWTGLELEGFGASLQHYNPLIDDEVKKNSMYLILGYLEPKCLLENHYKNQEKKNTRLLKNIFTIINKNYACSQSARFSC